MPTMNRLPVVGPALNQQAGTAFAPHGLRPFGKRQRKPHGAAPAGSLGETAACPCTPGSR
ncbi:hypothetical protein BLAT2472_40091 [Burkholderia latens]